MNINNCDYNTRNKQLCNFTLDCVNDTKPNQVHSPCPANDTELLGCSDNNNSLTCPVMLCNYEKDATINRTIFERNFPADKMCIIPDYRGEYKICAEYRSLDTKTKCPRTKNTDINPGKGSGLGYLQNIDVDSDLRLGYRSTLCPENKYVQPICDRIIVDNPYLLENPTCQNYKYSEFPNQKQQYKGKCGVHNHNGLDIAFNINQKSKTCMYNNSNQTKKSSNLKQPILGQYSYDMAKNNKLQTGPERTNHNLENVWSNVTRRKHI